MKQVEMMRNPQIETLWNVALLESPQRVNLSPSGCPMNVGSKADQVLPSQECQSETSFGAVHPTDQASRVRAMMLRWISDDPS